MESALLLLKVLWAPGETMFRVAKNPRIFAPIALLTVISAIGAGVAYTHLDYTAIAIRALEQSGRLRQASEEQKEQVRQAMENSPARSISFVFGCAAPFIMISVVTVIYFGLFTLIGTDGGFKSFMAVTSFAFVPSVIRQAAMMLTILWVPSSAIMPDELGSISPATFVDRSSVSRAVFTLINQIDIVSIWILVLLVIGYRFVLKKKVSTVTRIAGVFSIWAVYVGVRVAISSISGV